MSGNYKQRRGHSVSGLSGLDSNHNGSMFLPKGIMENMNVLDARTATDTYMERAVAELDRASAIGSATMILINEVLVQG